MKKLNKPLRQTQRKVAIFDIDGTIFRSSLLVELTEALIHKGLFPKNARKVYRKAFRRWFNREDSYEKYMNAVVEAFIRNIAGVRRAEFLKVAERVTAFHHNQVYRYTRDLVQKLKKQKYYILAISNSPREIVDAFCKRSGFDKVYGRIYEVGRDGKFTGRVSYEELISDKSKILRRAVEKEGLTLRCSIGVGDTESDIAFLKMVEHPICFNPNKKLYQYGKRAGWEIVVERKDVIYDAVL